MRRRSVSWLYGVFALSYLAIYFAALDVNGMRLDFAIRSAANTVLPDVLLGIPVLWLPRALPWPLGNRSGFFAILSGLLVVFFVMSCVLWCTFVGLDALAFDGRFLIRVDPRTVPWRFLSATLIYTSLAGIAYAWDNAAASQAQARRASHAEGLRAQAELAAMRSQLNPHFIFNTLHALIGMVRRDPPLAEEALERLGDLLRYGMRIQREGVDEVPLREEWRFVSSYLELEKLRLGERLRLEVHVEERSLDCRIPCFALQTLVENAVRNAIAPRSAPGRLSIDATIRDDRLRLEVRDDGPGASWGQVFSGEGLGLRLVRDRIAALYGDRGRLQLSAAEGGGASVLLEIPCLVEDD